MWVQETCLLSALINIVHCRQQNWCALLCACCSGAPHAKSRCPDPNCRLRTLCA